MSLHSDTRWLLTGAVVVLGGAALVSIAALRHEPAEPLLVASADAPVEDAPAARSYRELRDGRRGPNATMYGGVSEALAEGGEEVEAPTDSATDMRAAEVSRRAVGRAYEGAPPTVPHAVSQRELDCSGCHTRGATVAGKRAPKMSHPPYPSCSQCHVPRAGAPPISEDLPPAEMAESSFVGQPSAGRGARAWQGAPPTIPHATKMRSDCSSCHGATGAPGLRTTHPERASCTQCHAPSAVLDQRAPWGGAVADEEEVPR